MKSYAETRVEARAYLEVSYKILYRVSPAVPRVISVGVDGLRKHTQRVRDALVTLSFCVYNTRQLIPLYVLYLLMSYSPARAQLSFTSTVRQFVSLTITTIRIDRFSRCFERVYLPPTPSDGCTRFPPFLIFNPLNK